MNYKKNSMVDTDEDLKFIPLNLNEPFKSKDSSWAPFINIDVETENMTNNFFISLPDLQTNNGLTPLPSVNANPILPYPTTNPSMNGLNNNYDNMDLNNNLNIPPDNTNNISDENELYPSETSKDELYSYNTNSSGNNSNRDTLTHLDILRDFDLSLDSDIIDTTSGYRSDDIDRIFNNIEENNGDLLCALKAYNVPYPIASLILKKTIKSAINNLTNV